MQRKRSESVGPVEAAAGKSGSTAKRKPASKRTAVGKRTLPAGGAGASPIAGTKRSKGQPQPGGSAPKSVIRPARGSSGDRAAGPESGGKSHAGKAKLVRDSFTFPESDYALFGQLKTRALAAGREVKKGELLRAGLATLSGMTDRAFLRAIDAVERIKTGRPSK